MDFTTILGLTAGTLTTAAYCPQLIKTWKTKSAQDLSWSMLITLCVGIVLWLIYGTYEHDVPVIVANICTFAFATVILVLKIRYQYLKPVPSTPLPISMAMPFAEGMVEPAEASAVAASLPSPTPALPDLVGSAAD